eukprot:CAMPEP_0195018534 /NCGR_PEP_ID=MMETSP0326_2-20130528/30539_1 /TAXON_ID=2866 ORGANISM="Crypthecodinium cohnii, Strain Seligo" /NCGR_SAMPLE_ID=MMETSP0326_2 /ASSEMBLY_ACC=CAM_ASM_000348 /LENGTH=30 /DNA_ID= /DNA_START= /DNA_END= /DNA_ORIENTATION=
MTVLLAVVLSAFSTYSNASRSGLQAGSASS